MINITRNPLDPAEYYIKTFAPNPNEGNEVQTFMLRYRSTAEPPTDDELKNILFTELAEIFGRAVTNEDLNKWRAEYRPRRGLFLR